MSNLPYIDLGDPHSPLPYTDDKTVFLARRAGKITASGMADMLAKGEGKTRAKYAEKLAYERLTGLPMRGGFANDNTRHGETCEAEALELYGILHDVDIELVGFTPHPALSFAGCSPDALIGKDGMAQVKCPTPLVHTSYLKSRAIPRPYWLQMQFEMACTGRVWSDFVSFDPDQIPRLRLLVIRAERDDKTITMLEHEAQLFEKEINLLLKEYQSL